MKKISLVSRWFDIRINLHINDTTYAELRVSEEPMSLIIEDVDRAVHKATTRYISQYQALKIHRFFGHGNQNHFNTIHF